MKRIILFLMLFSQIIFAVTNEKAFLEFEKELDKISYDGNAKSLSRTTYKANKSPVHYARPFDGVVGVRAVEVDYIDGKREGRVVFNKPSGEILIEGAYKNDKKDGLWRYFPNGFLEREQEFKNGIYSGKNIFYYPNGNIRISINYVKGKKDGEVLEYYESGALWSKGKYVNNRLDGDFEIYYPSGALYMKSSYRSDRRVGGITYYYENGALLLEGKVSKDKPSGNWKFYGENQEIKYEGKFEEISPLFAEEFNINLMKTLRNN